MEDSHLPPLTPREVPAFGPSRPLPSPARGREAREAGVNKARQTAQHSWAHANVKYLPNEARREAEAAVAAAREEAARQRANAEECSRRCEVAERRAQDAEAEAARKVRDAEWTFGQEATGYQERIAALDQLLEDERREHAAELEQREEASRASQEAAELRVQQAQERCAAAVAAAEQRAAEAERQAEEARRAGAAELSAERARAGYRVQDARREAAAAVQEAERRRKEEVEQLRAEVAAEKRSMEAAVSASRQREGRAVGEAERRIREREQSLGEWRTSKELELSKKDASLEAWAEAKRMHHAAVEGQHKEVLALERDMHRRTMERTLDRVTRYLSSEGGDCEGGRDTPTREVIEAASAPEVGGLLALDIPGVQVGPAAVDAPSLPSGAASDFDSLIEAVLRQSAKAIAAYAGNLDERGSYSREEEWPVQLPPGYTALGVAAAFGKRRAAEALLQAGASPGAMDASGAFPLAIALAAQQPEIAELIRSWPRLHTAMARVPLDPEPAALFEPQPAALVEFPRGELEPYDEDSLTNQVEFPPGELEPYDEDEAAEADDKVSELPFAYA